MNPIGGEWELLSINRGQVIGMIVRCKFKRGSECLILDIDVDERDWACHKYSVWVMNDGRQAKWIAHDSPHAKQLGAPALIEKYEPLARMMLL